MAKITIIVWKFWLIWELRCFYRRYLFISSFHKYNYKKPTFPFCFLLWVRISKKYFWLSLLRLLTTFPSRIVLHIGKDKSFISPPLALRVNAKNWWPLLSQMVRYSLPLTHNAIDVVFNRDKLVAGRRHPLFFNPISGWRVAGSINLIAKRPKKFENDFLSMPLLYCDNQLLYDENSNLRCFI